jgi:hypothetical protein
MKHPVTWLCANAASGSNDEARRAAVKTALVQVGCTVARTIDVAEQEPPDRAQLEAGGVELLVLFTGDGTAHAVANACEGWAGKVLVLPGGTANLLAQALHGQRSAEEIIAALGSAPPIRRPCIRTSQGTALIEVLAGPGAAWSDVREEMREGNIATVASSSLAAIRDSTTGPTVAIVGPPLGKPEGYAGVRLEPKRRGIAVEGYGAETVGDYLRQGVALLRRDFRLGPHEELGALAELTCRSLGEARIELMIDGERRTGGSEERFVLDELGLDMLATRP